MSLPSAEGQANWRPIAAYSVFTTGKGLAQVAVPLNFGEVRSKIKYPMGAIADHVEGRVMMKIQVDSAGRVCQFEIFESIHPEIDEVIALHIHELRFQPATVDHQPRASWVVLPMYFSLTH